MSWQAARHVAQEVIDRFPEDLKGQTVSYPEFKSDGDCRFFFPMRGLAFHRSVVRAFRRWIHRRGARTIPIVVSSHDFKLAHPEATADAESNSRNKHEFAAQNFRIVPVQPD